MTDLTRVIVSVNLSTEKGTVKTPVPQGVITPLGLEGDAHAGPWHRQVSLLDQGSIDRFGRELGRDIAPGEFAENLTTRGLEAVEVALLDRLDVGPAHLEVTQIGKECHGEGCAIFQAVGRCVMPVDGLFTRVLQGGTVHAGARLIHQPRTLQVLVLTLSDRASAGLYEDRSGPRMRERLQSWFGQRRFRADLRSGLLTDDPDALRAALEEAYGSKIDLVFTTGGTGLGPRDHAPEVVLEFVRREIPGIAERVRLKAAEANPHAVLSRAVAGTRGSLAVFALPGSPGAVDEYLDEIFRSLEHLILTLNGAGH